MAARGSSNAGSGKAFAGRQSVQIWSILLHEAVDENKGGSPLYLLLHAGNARDGEVFDHVEWQNGYTCQHALQSMLFIYFIVIIINTLFACVAWSASTFLKL